jgi:hypothetical protein
VDLLAILFKLTRIVIELLLAENAKVFIGARWVMFGRSAPAVLLSSLSVRCAGILVGWRSRNSLMETLFFAVFILVLLALALYFILFFSYFLSG